MSTWVFKTGTGKGPKVAAGPGVGEQAKERVEVLEQGYTVAAEDDDDDANLAHVQETLSALRGFGRLALFRKKPTWCAGFLCSIELDKDEEIDLSAIKRDWGGGEIQFRPQRYTSNGVRFAPGGRTLRFTGPPRENGVEITPDGYFGPTRSTAPAVVLQQDRPVRQQASSNNTLEQLVVMLVDRLTAQPRALAAPPPPARESSDPLEQLGKSIATFKQLERLMGGAPQAEEEEVEEGPAEPPWLGRLIETALDKIESKKKPQQQQQAAPSWRLHKSAQAPAPAARPAPRAAPAAAPAAAAPGPARTVRELLDGFRGLNPRERMELLGTLSGELDPALIREYMAANLGHVDDDEGEAVGG